MVLGKLNRLDLLSDLFAEVVIPQAVYDEVVVRGATRGSVEALVVRMFWRAHDWPIIAVSEELRAAYTPSVVLGSGETEVLVLAQSYGNALVLLDDEAARVEARRLRLQVCGTLGVLVRAHRRGLLTLPQAELLISEIAVRPDIWIAAKLCEQVLASLREPR